MRLSVLALASALAVGHAAEDWTENVQELFGESMSWMDTYYDSKAGYLYDLDREKALRHNTRSSAWYALGLLARNEGSDASEAEKIIEKVIGGQFIDTSKQWYGTYQKYPEEPEVGSEHYASSIYNSWDPNWRGFVATTFIVMLEEYSDLISDKTQELIMESLYHATEGDTYRVGGVDGDNLYPSYSNPALMRAFVSGWMGRRVDNSNMTKAGENYATEIIELYNETDTLSEFNSATYTGVSLFALILWSTYLPDDSVMTQMGPKMYRETWEIVETLWNTDMRNMAGPWDRAYGFDMNRYLSVMGLWLWAYLDKESAGIIHEPKIMTHSADYAWGPLVAVLAKTGQDLLPDGFFDNFGSLDEERTFEASAYYPPYDHEHRNITTWMSRDLTIGAASFNQTQVGGPTGQFIPAVVQWQTEDEVAFLILRSRARALRAEVEPGKLSLTYPDGGSDIEFVIHTSTFVGKPTIASLEDIPGLDITVSGNINKDYVFEFAGENGGAGSTSNSFEMWTFKWRMPDSYDGPPNLVLEFETT